MDIFINKKIWRQFTDEQTKEYVNNVFKYYRQHGFPYYPTDKITRDKNFDKFITYNGVVLENKKLKQTMHGLNLAWSYFPHMWEIQCNGLKTPMDLFNDDEMLKAVISKRMRMGDNMSDAGLRKMLKIYTGTQCVSNFRPTSAKALYDEFAPDGVVYDMCCGFGGRLLGFIGSKAKTYIGTEPSSKTFDGLNNLKKDYGSNKDIQLYKCGSEDFTFQKDNSVDFCFTSPPYFDCEHYSDEGTQSYIKFNTKQSWINGYLKQTFDNCYRMLKPNKFMAINIANVKSFKDLEENTIQTAITAGFEYTDKYFYCLSSLSHKSDFKYEPVFLFKKIS